MNPVQQRAASVSNSAAARRIKLYIQFMAEVKDPSLVPHGGAWVFKHPLSGAVLRHHALGPMFAEVTRYNQAKGYPTITLQEFTDNVCANAYPGTCTGSGEGQGHPVPSDPPMVDRPWGWSVGAGRAGRPDDPPTRYPYVPHS